MNILLYFHKLDSFGGAERMICMLANRLSADQQNVHLLSLNKSKDECYYPLNGAIHWHKVGQEVGLFGKIRRILTIAKILRDNKIDVLVGFVMSGDKTILAAAKLAGVKLIAAERNAPSMYEIRYTKKQKRSSFWLLSKCDHITTQFESFIEHYPENLRPIMTAISNEVRNMPMKATPGQANDQGRFVVLSVARFDPVQKRLDILVDAFLNLAGQYTQWDLHLVGAGPDLEKMKELVHQRDLQHRVKFIASSNTVENLYGEANLFAIPSKWEGFPNALAEALSSGLPAVGFQDALGVADLIGSDNGWLALGNENIEGFQSALENAMKENEMRIQKGENALKAMEKYQQNDPYENWLETIQHVVLGNQ